MAYTTSELAALSGVTARTLRYYDRIGLLTLPLAANGYRQYGQAEVDRLQLILTYRALGFALAEIQALLPQPPAKQAAMLGEQRKRLLAERRQVDRQLQALDVTLANQKGGSEMADLEKFEALKRQRLQENDAAFGQEVEARYGKAAKAAADARYAGLTEAQYQAMTEAEGQLKAALLQYLAAPVLPSAASKQAYTAHRTWLLATTPNLTGQMHRALAAMYTDDPRFTAYYTKLTGDARAAAALRQIIEHYTREAEAN